MKQQTSGNGSRDNLIEVVGQVVGDPIKRSRYERMTNSTVTYYVEFELQTPPDSVEFRGFGEPVGMGRRVRVRAMGNNAAEYESIERGQKVKILARPRVETYLQPYGIEFLNGSTASASGDDLQHVAAEPTKQGGDNDDDDDVVDPFLF